VSTPANAPPAPFPREAEASPTSARPAELVSSASGDVLLRGRRLKLAQGFWIGFVICVWALFIVAIPARLNELLRVCAGETCAIGPEQARALEQLGISVGFFAGYTLALEVALALGFSLVGLIIFARRRDERMAIWLSLALVIFGTATPAPLQALERAQPGWLLPVEFLRYLGVVMLLLSTCIFPDGHFVPRWTRRTTLLWALWLLPFYLFGNEMYRQWPWLLRVFFSSLLLAFGTGVLAQFYRYRRALNPVQQQQTKWVLFGLTGAFVGYFGVTLPYVFSQLSATGRAPVVSFDLVSVGIRTVAILLVPATIGIAILRYRLFEIDILINRAFVYGTLTAILAGVYAASMTSLQKFFIALTGQESDAAIVVTTLILTTTFTPVKNWLESIASRRFKETPEPIENFRRFGDEVRTFVELVDPDKITRRLLAEAVGTFNANSGAVYLQRDGEMQLLATSGNWNGDARLSVPLKSEGQEIGRLALGARRNGRGYSDEERARLEEIASLVADAIGLTQADGAS
jgi:hypothetical protein